MPTLTPQIIGRAENAHKPLMEYALADTGLTFTQWVALTLITSGQAEIVDRIVGALKVTPDVAQAALADLRSTGLISQSDALTDQGRTTFALIRGQIEELIARAYADIDPGELTVAARVLTTITAQADAVAAELGSV